MNTRVSVTRKRYADFNLHSKDAPSWPSSLPSLDGDEAMSAVRRLYRFAMKRRWPGKMHVTSGNRYTWPRNGDYAVNAAKGWRELVHDVSHYCHRKLHPNESGHGWHHAKIEAAMIAFVIRSGWLDGKLKPKPKTVKAVNPAERLRARIMQWERKQRRADNALRKLRRRLAAIEKRRAWTPAA